MTANDAYSELLLHQLIKVDGIPFGLSTRKQYQQNLKGNTVYFAFPRIIFALIGIH
jgi:hypothetical protein